MFLFPSRKKMDDLLSKLEGDRIYIENVRVALDSSYTYAKKICEKSVRNGTLEKWISYRHPTDNYEIVEVMDGYDLPDEPIIDVKAQAEGADKYEFMINELRKEIFYKMPR